LFLREHYGDEIVRVDYGKKENRQRSADDMALADFLSIYNNTNRYLIDTLPKKMWKEFSLPRCLLCGGFTDALQVSD
jgi:lysine-specific demethylase 8